MIELVAKEKCSGCSACFNACKESAIVMETDETGFWFPRIIREKCVECKKCVSTCPAIEKIQYPGDAPKAYIVQNIDDEIRRQSTSGGAFTAIAKNVIEDGGQVFGAAIDEKGKVSHIAVKRVEDLSKFRSSKYVQSWIGSSYRDVKRLLQNGFKVCFSGTPCQVYGLKQYLGKDYSNLLTVDVMCRAVPSPKILQKYLDYQKEKYGDFNRIIFRDKSRGYSYSGIALYQENKVLYRGGSESDPWLRLFLGGYCNRETCHTCMYQTGTRASDITLWDCWGTQNYAPEWDDNKGTTNVIAWTEKGRRAIESSSEMRIKEIGIDRIDASLNRKTLRMPNYNREQFFLDAEEMSGGDFIKKYAPMTIKVRMKRFVRNTMYVLHIHESVRRAVHRLRKVRKGMKK